MKKYIALFAIAGALLTSGCATVSTMSPTTSTSSVDTTKNSYALMTVTLKNAYHTSYQPSPIVVHMERGAADSRDDRLNFKFDDQAATTSDTARTLLRVTEAIDTAIAADAVATIGTVAYIRKAWSDSG